MASHSKEDSQSFGWRGEMLAHDPDCQKNSGYERLNVVHIKILPKSGLRTQEASRVMQMLAWCEKVLVVETKDRSVCPIFAGPGQGGAQMQVRRRWHPTLDAEAPHCLISSDLSRQPTRVGTLLDKHELLPAGGILARS
jgi:hypothetical protein